MDAPKPSYEEVFEIIKDKDYLVITKAVYDFQKLYF